MNQRQLSPYERNHLLRHGIDPAKIDDYGEMPVEYITNRVEFCGHELFVDNRVLIPRVETEELVNLAVKIAVDRYHQLRRPPHIFDVGTGSGALGIAVSLALAAQGLPHHLVLSDVSAAALDVAHTNTHKLLRPYLSSLLTVQLIESNLLADFPPKLMADLIIANLPYIPSARISQLHPSVTHFEPHSALDGGDDGLDLIRRLATQAQSRLTPQGKILLEIDDTHTEDMIRSATQASTVSVLTDYRQANRFAVVEYS